MALISSGKAASAEEPPNMTDVGKVTGNLGRIKLMNFCKEFVFYISCTEMLLLPL